MPWPPSVSTQRGQYHAPSHLTHRDGRNTSLGTRRRCFTLLHPPHWRQVKLEETQTLAHGLPSFFRGETEAQRGGVTCLKSHSETGAELS